MPAYEACKRQVIDRILENEALTDGLDDEVAQRIIAWCLHQVETYATDDTHALEAYGQWLMRQGRIIARIAQHIQDGDDVSHIQRWLQRLSNDPTTYQNVCTLLLQNRPLEDYIDVLLRVAEGG
jgi:hypothetical protein